MYVLAQSVAAQGKASSTAGDNQIAEIEDTLEKMAERLWDHEQAQAHEDAWAGKALR